MQQRRAGGRTHLVCRDESPAMPRGKPQHEVGKREVGEQGPVGNERTQVIEVGLGQVGALARYIIEPGHAVTLAATTAPP